MLHIAIYFLGKHFNVAHLFVRACGFSLYCKYYCDHPDDAAGTSSFRTSGMNNYFYSMWYFYMGIGVLIKEFDNLVGSFSELLLEPC